MVILILGLTLYAIYTPIFLFSLKRSTTLFDRYKASNNWVSELGISTQRSSKLFNPTVGIYGLLSLSLVFGLQQILPLHTATRLFLFYLTTTCISTVFVGVFPMDRSSVFHVIASIISWFSALASFGLVLYITLKFGVLPAILLPTNIGYFVTVILYLLAAIYEPTAKTNWQKFVVKHKGMWEWSCLVMATVWNFSACVILLVKFIYEY